MQPFVVEASLFHLQIITSLISFGVVKNTHGLPDSYGQPSLKAREGPEYRAKKNLVSRNFYFPVQSHKRLFII
jgi:hypothetical protein